MTPRELARTIRPRNKYNARAFRDAAGVHWDSQAEYLYWLKLQDRERRAEITELQRQYAIEVIPAFTDQWGRKHRARVLHVDFRYVEVRTGWTWIEDVKGRMTEAFSLRWEMAQMLFSECRDVRFRLISAKTLAPIGKREVP